MNYDIEVKIIKELPIEKINQYVDLVVYGVAKKTEDYTLAENRFPKKTGNLEISSMAQEIRQEKHGVYCLDVPAGAEYAKYVWNMPQDTTNWTNPDTYSKWFATTYENKKELITQQAVDIALRSIK